MLTAIHLNNQPHFHARKVEHKIQKWMLAAELETGNLPTTQALPQTTLGIGHMASQLALKRIVDDRTVCLALQLYILFLLGYPIPTPALPLKVRERRCYRPTLSITPNCCKRRQNMPG